VSTQFCTNCGLPIVARFCTQCGAATEASSTVPPILPSQAPQIGATASAPITPPPRQHLGQVAPVWEPKPRESDGQKHDGPWDRSLHRPPVGWTRSQAIASNTGVTRSRQNTTPSNGGGSKVALSAVMFSVLVMIGIAVVSTGGVTPKWTPPAAATASASTSVQAQAQDVQQSQSTPPPPPPPTYSPPAAFSPSSPPTTYDAPAPNIQADPCEIEEGEIKRQEAEVERLESEEHRLEGEARSDCQIFGQDSSACSSRNSKVQDAHRALNDAGDRLNFAKQKLESCQGMSK
jgi:hypothetical protein